jgi:hypothetical protein
MRGPNHFFGAGLRLTVFDEVFRWHQHPTTDELFLVVDGMLAIDFSDGSEVRLAVPMGERGDVV